MSCAPNADYNAGIIDIWQRQTSKEREQRINKTTFDYQREMKKIRRTHICHHCRKYPGDGEYSMGLWEKNRYYCFDHIPL